MGNMTLLQIIYKYFVETFTSDRLGLSACPYAQIAVQYGSTEIMDIMAKRGLIQPCDADWISVAVKGGHLENMIWLCERLGCVPYYGSIMVKAIEHDHIHIMEWLLTVESNLFGQFDDDVVAQDRICNHLVGRGTVKMVKWCEAHGFSWKGRDIRIEDTSFITGRGPEVFIFLCENGMRVSNESEIFAADLHHVANMTMMCFSLLSNGPDDRLLEWGARTKKPAFINLVKSVREMGGQDGGVRLPDELMKMDRILKIAQKFGL